MFFDDAADASGKIALHVARYLSPGSNKIVERVGSIVAGASSQLRAHSQRQRQRQVLCLGTGAGAGGGGEGRCNGISSGVLSALMRLASSPALASAGADEVLGNPDKEKEQERGRAVRYPVTGRVVAIGDVHGDYDAFQRLLQRAKLMNDAGDWIGGRATLVQVGDQLDRGDGERRIYEMLFRLQDNAPRAGGAVHILIGNHEMMNVNLDFRYVTAGGFADFLRAAGRDTGRSVTKPFRALIKQLPPELRARARALAPGGQLACELAERAQVAVMIGDSVFVHAGLAPSHFGQAPTGEEALRNINEHTRQFLKGERDQLPKVLEGAGGPLWMRTYSRPHVRGGGPECQMLSQTLKMLRAKRMVVGHTVQPMINAACGGRVWRVDTGLSSAYGGVAEALEILPGGRIQVVTPNGVVDGRRRAG